MKRLFFSFLMIFVCAAASAQQHMQFMGIPLDGSIDSFTTKLKEKGITPDPDPDVYEYTPGARLFVGVFYGKSADIHAYFDVTTKNVYRGKAIIDDTDFKRLYDLFNEISNVIEGKYIIVDKLESTHRGYPAISYFIDLESSSDVCEGRIDLYFIDHDMIYNKEYALQVDYYDMENYLKREESISNDI